MIVLKQENPCNILTNCNNASVKYALMLYCRELLTHAGKISQQQSKDKSAQTLDKYREQQKIQEVEESLQEIEADIKRLGEGNE